MIEHDQLIEFAKDEDDYPVMLYLAQIGKVIDWKESFPDEVLYVPENIFQAVAREFIDDIGLDGYYNKTILNQRHTHMLCQEREQEDLSNEYLVTLETLRKFIGAGQARSKSHYIAFEGP